MNMQDEPYMDGKPKKREERQKRGKETAVEDEKKVRERQAETEDYTLRFSKVFNLTCRIAGYWRGLSFLL